MDYAGLLVPNTIILDKGNMKTVLIDLRDFSPYIIKFITDERTINKYVFYYGELL
jgi:hypothetical protein